MKTLNVHSPFSISHANGNQSTFAKGYHKNVPDDIANHWMAKASSTEVTTSEIPPGVPVIDTLAVENSAAAQAFANEVAAAKAAVDTRSASEKQGIDGDAAAKRSAVDNAAASEKLAIDTDFNARRASGDWVYVDAQGARYALDANGNYVLDAQGNRVAEDSAFTLDAAGNPVYADGRRGTVASRVAAKAEAERVAADKVPSDAAAAQANANRVPK